MVLTRRESGRSGTSTLGHCVRQNLFSRTQNYHCHQPKEPRINNLAIWHEHCFCDRDLQPAVGGVMTQEKGKWREICEAMVKESDPRKMSELAAQLVAALDEQKSGSGLRAKNIQTESPTPESGSRLIRWAVRSTSGHRANVAREQEETRGTRVISCPRLLLNRPRWAVTVRAAQALQRRFRLFADLSQNQSVQPAHGSGVRRAYRDSRYTTF